MPFSRSQDLPYLYTKQIPPLFSVGLYVFLFVFRIWRVFSFTTCPRAVSGFCVRFCFATKSSKNIYCFKRLSSTLSYLTPCTHGAFWHVLAGVVFSYHKECQFQWGTVFLTCTLILVVFCCFFEKISGACVCRVTFKHLPQPLRSHIRCFHNTPSVRPNMS
jgi:hypothetical protein